MSWRFEKLDSYADRMRRSSREIVIAAALTLAAVAFLIAAFMGGAVTSEKDVGHIAAEDTIIE